MVLYGLLVPIFHLAQYASMHPTLMYPHQDFATIEMHVCGLHRPSQQKRKAILAMQSITQHTCRALIKMIRSTRDRQSNVIEILCDCQLCASEAKRIAVEVQENRSNVKIAMKRVHRRPNRSVEAIRSKGAEAGR